MRGTSQGLGRKHQAWKGERGKGKPQGLVLVFTGDGKGKTTAALGTALRMLGHGKRVGMVQFFKPKPCTPYSGHFAGLQIWYFGGGFTWKTPPEENAKAVQKAWQKCRVLLRDPKYSLVILDEIHIALKYKFLKSSEVIRALNKRPAGQHVILTGRGAPAALIRTADLVTEMRCRKHPFDCGIPAQPGIEF